MKNNRKVLITAAVAGLFAAGTMMKAAPSFADEAGAPAAAEGKPSCKGAAGCKGKKDHKKKDHKKKAKKGAAAAAPKAETPPAADGGAAPQH